MEMLADTLSMRNKVNSCHGKQTCDWLVKSARMATS